MRHIVNLVSFGVGGDILIDVWDSWQKASREEQRAAEVQATAQMSADELRAEVTRIVREEGAALSAAQQARVASYLTQVPAMIRRSLRRPSDPTGTTVAAGKAFRSPEDLLPLLPPALPRFKPGDRPPGIGDWELVELLGVGGFGEVWKAHNPHCDGMAPVALKFCLDPKARERLLTHEAKILNQIMRQGKHEGIVPLLHTYLSADPPCLAYEYIDGGDLAGLIQARRDGLPPWETARVVQRLAEIVGFAHRLSPPVVHRDLKPANILMKAQTQGKLALRITDFGIGGLAVQQAVSQSQRRTTSGEFLTAAVRGAYTPLYASPQQMRGEERPDPRDDVYALGVIWYQLLTGDLTKGRPGGEAWRKRLADRGMTPALLALLASSYEDERADRPATGADLAEKLGLALQELSPASPPPIRDSQEALDADWRTYMEFAGQDNEEGFLRKHAPARLRAWHVAAEQGKPEGQVLLGSCFLEGIEVEEDAAEALKWFRKAAEQGFAFGQVALGHLYRIGENVPRDEHEAAKWYGKAVQLYRRAAEQGNADAQNRLGIMYTEGLCVAKNDAEAIKWSRKAAEQGVPASQCDLGFRYMEGRGLRQDDAEAVKWLRKAADQDFAPAQTFLGLMYSEGRGVPQDAAEVVKWISRASAQSERCGTFGLGLMLSTGWWLDDLDPLSRYNEAAEQAYAKAGAKLGDANAQAKLGGMYRGGEGVAKDEAEAARWYRKAAEQGHEDAKKALKRLSSFWRRLFGI